MFPAARKKKYGEDPEQTKLSFTTEGIFNSRIDLENSLRIS